MYRYFLDVELINIDLPYEAITCADFSCKKHFHEYNNFSKSIIGACESSMKSSISKVKNKKFSKTICDWNTKVRPYRDSAIMWHRVWKQCGSPSTGIVANIRRSTRSQYHEKINEVKSNQENLKKIKMTNALLSKKL